MNVEKFYETLTKIIAEREGVNIKVNVERREDETEYKTIPTSERSAG